MADRGKVLKGLECCIDPLKARCPECPYYPCYDEDTTSEKLLADSLALLKEQEPVTCAECKYWIPMNRFHQDYHPGRGECELNCCVRDSDWFCADGEAKEDD